MCVTRESHAGLSSQGFAYATPQGGGGLAQGLGMGTCHFQNSGCPLLMGPPSRGAWGWAKSGLVVLRGRAIFPSKIFPLIFSFVLVCVSGWVPLELTPPPPTPTLGGRALPIRCVLNVCQPLFIAG